VLITSPVGVVTATPLLSYSVTGGSVNVYIDNNLVTKVSGSNLDALGAGTHTVRVEATDATGMTQAAQVTFIVDTLAPTGSISINGGAAYATGTSVTLNLTATDANGVSHMQFKNSGGTWSTPEPFANTKTWTLAEGDGTKTVYVKFRDTTGNWSVAYSGSIILDTAAPLVIITAPIGLINTNTPILLYTAPEGTVKVKVDGEVVSRVSGDALSLLSEGPHTIRVESTDGAGNVGFSEASIIVDAIPPTVSINTVASPTSINNQTIAGNREVGAVIAVVVNTAASVGPVSYPTATSWSCTITGLAVGKNNIVVTATDEYGVYGQAAATIKFDGDLVGLWHMDGDWTDASGRGNNGGPVNGPAFSADSMTGASAGSFNGNGSYVYAVDSSTLDLTTAMTLEAWIKPGNIENYRQIISKFGSSGDYSYQLGLAPSGSLRVDISGDGTTYDALISNASLLPHLLKIDLKRHDDILREGIYEKIDDIPS
jgi:hypothetical protein